MTEKSESIENYVIVSPSKKIIVVIAFTSVVVNLILLLSVTVINTQKSVLASFSILLRFIQTSIFSLFRF